jgi:hypothetical protein
MQWFLYLLLGLPLLLFAEIEQTQRTMIGLWDSKEQHKIVKSSIPLGLEMPLNYLGIRVEYHDVQQPLPDLSRRNDVLGIILWFPDNYPYENADSLIEWVNSLIDQGKKLIFVISPYSLSELSTHAHITELLAKLGILQNDNWVPYTYNYELGTTKSGVYPFEASLDLTLPSFIKLKTDSHEIDPIISLKRKDSQGTEIPMVFIHANGLFAFDSYFVKAVSINDEIKTKWLVNPFKTLQNALNWHDIPVPDATTLCGRRIYYSQIDGDGWSNATLTIRENNVDPTLSAEIILEKFVGPAKDMPVTVAPIAGDMNPAWFGTPKTQEIARQYFALPQVEIGCHTYSHPFDWGFFRNYTPQKERPYLHSYPTKTFDDGTFAFFKTLIPKPSSYYSVLTDAEKKKSAIAHSELEKGYTIPRAFAVEPFDLTLEITGAIHEINALAPPDKIVEVYQWSGNGQAFPEAVKVTQEDHVQNINGGNSQLDFAHPSYGDVTALGINLDGYYQVYNSNSNENNYTELWTENFYGFVTLPRTFQWTESPLRIKPIDLYYHMYSGERQSSLAALHKNMDFIRSQNIIPIHTSHYCHIVDGFYATQIIHQDNDRWTVSNRGDLQTLRLDNAVFTAIDFQSSKGVLGQRHYQGSLYIALDPLIKEPELSFKEVEDSSVEPIESVPYLLESRWQISGLSREGNLSFEAIGFGPLEATFIVPKERIYRIEATTMAGEALKSEWTPSQEHHLKIAMDLPYQTPMRITISEEGQAP